MQWGMGPQFHVLGLLDIQLEIITAATGLSTAHVIYQFYKVETARREHIANSIGQLSGCHG